MLTDSPRGLHDPEAVAARLLLLESAPTVQPLRQWASEMVTRRQSRQPNILVPHFDPLELGVESKVLLLLEAPGPMTNASNVRPGSGFISVDNDDVTAENCWNFRESVGLREGVLHWNIVPWYLGAASRKPNAGELEQGAMELRRLLPLLPELRVVLLGGIPARKGWSKHVAPFVGTTITTIDTWHPSPLAMKQPGKRDDLQRAFARAAAMVR